MADDLSFFFISGFETGGTTAWTTSGTGITVPAAGYSGTYCVKIADASSYISKTFTASSQENSSWALSLHINMQDTGTGYVHFTCNNLVWKVELVYGTRWQMKLYENGVQKDVTKNISYQEGQWKNLTIVGRPKRGLVYWGGTKIFEVAVTNSSTTYGPTLIKIENGSGADLMADDVVGGLASAYMGALRVLSSVPASDYSVAMTPSTAGYHYGLVDDRPNDGDSSYVYTAGSSQDYTDLFTGTKLGIPSGKTIGTIYGVQVTSMSRDLGTAANKVQLALADANGTYYSADKTPGTGSYARMSKIWYVNPGTGATWKASEIASSVLFFGVKHNMADANQLRTTQVVLEAIVDFANRKVPRNPGALDLSFHFHWADFSPLNYFEVIWNASIADKDSGPDYTYSGKRTALRYSVADSYYWLSVYSIDSGNTYTLIEKLKTEIASGLSVITRIVAHDKFITVFMNAFRVVTFSLPDVKWFDTLTTKVKSSGASFSIHNVLLKELSDWREGVFVDLESAGNAALSAIIQERPVKIWSRTDDMAFSYGEPSGSAISINSDNVRAHQKTQRETSGGSDIIVYAEDVYVVHDADFATDFGFQTRILRLSTLGNGAPVAAKRIMQTMNESRILHKVVMRPDIRIEVGDRLSITYTGAGDGRSETFDMAVEGVSIEVSDGNGTMTVIGRELA